MFFKELFVSPELSRPPKHSNALIAFEFVRGIVCPMEMRINEERNACFEIHMRLVFLICFIHRLAQGNLLFLGEKTSMLRQPPSSTF
jgi:hypothetical protein